MPKDNQRNIFPTKKLTVKDGDGLREKVVIQHDLTEFIRETFGLNKEKRSRPADVIPLKRDPH